MAKLLLSGEIKTSLAEVFIASLNRETERSQNTCKILYLSGTPGSGKTTCTKAISRELEIQAIPEFLDQMPKWVLDTRKSTPDELKLTAEMWVLHQYIKKNSVLKELKRGAVVDRTWLDAVLYSMVYGDYVTYQILSKVREVEWINGIYLLLIANPNVTEERLRKRFNLSKDQWKSEWKEYVIGLYEYSKAIGNELNIPIIDTSCLNLVDTLTAIKRQFLNY